MASWNIYSKNGDLRCVAHSLEYSEEWMVSECVIVSISSNAPINFEVGDYLIYRGLHYSIYSLPSTLKASRINTYGDGFKWDGIKLYSDSMRLGEIRFLDYVLYDNNLHYTSLPEFAFYAETVDDLIDRLQANTDRTDNGWVFLTPNLDRTIQRYLRDESLEESDESEEGYIENLWKSYYGENGENTDLGKNVTNINISISNNSVLEGLALINTQFGINFTTRDKLVLVGLKGVEANKVFKYGKGNGLYEIERQAEDDQFISTKLYAYGSNQNLPSHYYADLYTAPFAEVKSINFIYDEVNYLSAQYELELAYDKKYFTDDEEIIWCKYYDDHSVKVRSGDYDITAVASHLFENHKPPKNTDKFLLNCKHSFDSSDVLAGQEPDADALRGFISSLSVGDKVYFTGYVNKSAFPASNISHIVSNLPDNMAVNVLMLPGFPDYSLSQLCYSEYSEEDDKTHFYYRKTPTGEYNEIMEVEGDHVVTFSNDRLQPYIVSPTYSTLGEKEGVINFTEDTDVNGLQDVHPTIEGMTVGEVFGTSSEERLDEVVSATMIEDNGVFGSKEQPNFEIPNFEITLKNLGFDLKEAFVNGGSQMVISMKDGYCGGRDFKVTSVKQNDDKTWKLSVNRLYDDSLDIYFPYSYHVAIGEEPMADEPYQIRTGDHFVLTEIEITDTTYINAASVRALKKAITWLLANDDMRYVYYPKVDNIEMARERDDAEKNGRTPLHDILKGGMLIHFEDEDFNVDASVFIDKITIKEGESPLPEYDIILRTEKSIGTLDRIKNQIESIASGVGGYTQGQIESMIARYGDINFLSKVKKDTAYNEITFNEGITFKKQSTHEKGVNFDGLHQIDGNGDAVLSDIDAETIDVDTEHSVNTPVAKFGTTTDSMTDGRGTLITGDGRIQTDRMEVRGTLTVLDMVASQIHSLDGYYYFTDSMKIAEVIPVKVADESDESGDVLYEEAEEGDTIVGYAIVMERTEESDRLKFYDGDILLSASVDLDAKEVAQRTTGEGGNTDFVNISSTSWLHVIATNEENPLVFDHSGMWVIATLDTNIQGNSVPEEGTYISRRGYDNANIFPSRPERQSSWCISVSEGRLTYYINQTSVGTSDENYGVVVGKLPDFTPARNTGTVGDIGVYAKTLLAEKVIGVKWMGNAEWVTIDMGEWRSDIASTNAYYFKKAWDGKKFTYTRVQVTYNEATWVTTAVINTDSGEVIITNPPSTDTGSNWNLVSGGSRVLETEIYYTTSETSDLDEGGVDMGAEEVYWSKDQSFFLKEYLDESESDESGEGELNPYYYCAFRPYMWRKTITKTTSIPEGFESEEPHIIGVNGQTGEVIQADLSDELTVIGVGSDGVLQTQSVIEAETDAHITKGGVDLNIIGPSITGGCELVSINNIPYDGTEGYDPDGDTTGTPIGLDFAMSVVGSTDLLIGFEFDTGLSFVDASSYVFKFRIVGTDGTTTYNRFVNYEVRGNREGADGVVYELLPSVTSIKKSGSTYSVNSVSVDCYTRQGGTSTLVTSPIVRYIKDGAAEANYTGAISSSTITSYVTFIWYADANHTVVLDRETVLMIADGTNGTNGQDAVTYDIRLSDESVKMLADGTTLPGTIIISPYKTIGSGTPTAFSCYIRVYGGISYSYSGTGTSLTFNTDLSDDGEFTPEQIEGIYPLTIEIKTASNGTLLATKQVQLIKDGEGLVSRVFTYLQYGSTYHAAEDYTNSGEYLWGGDEDRSVHFQDYLAIPTSSYESGYMILRVKRGFSYLPVSEEGETGESELWYPYNKTSTAVELPYKLIPNELGLSTTEAVKNFFVSHVSASVLTALHTINEYFEEVAVNMTSAFFTNLVAKNAYIDMLTGSRFQITDENNEVVAGMGNVDESDDTYMLWAGGSNPSEAPFSVTNMGDVKLNSGTFGGLIKFTPRVFTSENILEYVYWGDTMDFYRVSANTYARRQGWILNVEKAGSFVMFYSASSGDPTTSSEHKSKYTSLASILSDEALRLQNAGKITYDTDYDYVDSVYANLPWYAGYVWIDGTSNAPTAWLTYGETYLNIPYSSNDAVVQAGRFVGTKLHYINAAVASGDTNTFKVRISGSTANAQYQGGSLSIGDFSLGGYCDYVIENKSKHETYTISTTIYDYYRTLWEVQMGAANAVSSAYQYVKGLVIP